MGTKAHQASIAKAILIASLPSFIFPSQAHPTHPTRALSLQQVLSPPSSLRACVLTSCVLFDWLPVNDNPYRPVLGALFLRPLGPLGRCVRSSKRRSLSAQAQAKARSILACTASWA